MKIKNVLIIATLAALCGCAGLSNLLAPSAMPLEQAAVGAAVFTAETANHATSVQQTQRAVTINKIAKAILAVDQNSNMALSDIEIVVNSKITALNLPPQDLLLAQLLTASL